MIDSLFLKIIIELRGIPSILVSCINFFLCIGAVFVIRKKLGYAGLCCYMAVSSIIGNVQVLYATTYECLHLNVFLGTVIFCSTFLVCDIINTEYGAEKAKKAVYLTILTDIFFLANVLLTLCHKPLDYSQNPDFGISIETMKANMLAIHQIFLPVPRLLIASYSAFLASQLSEIWLFNFMKKFTLIKSNYLKHNLALFVSSVIIDTFTFTFLGFVLLSPEALSAADLFDICLSAIVIRTVCNMGNSFFLKKLKMQKQLT